MFHKLLVANRGEIACRVFRTAKQMGLSTVAVYSDADKFANHTKMGDQKYHIGGSTPLESYLKKEKIIEVMLRSGAQAVHPGYGFLSENSEFANLCEKNNLIFVGPPASAMDKMASKSESKDIMIKAGVPVTPGYHGQNQDPQYLKEEARKIQYPVIIKAVMGGGGKGMKICWKEDEFLSQLESAKREARKSFNDERVLIERFITRPKHIEIQVFGDQHGNYVYLFERDCSIQRRHQKVIEEAPSNIGPETRQKMGETAVAAAKAVGYYNAGTVEFIFDLDRDEYYFMEMNTRLQVEHPISEEITGQDFVEWQLKVASGQKLPLFQKDLKINGHALEARVYSEDPITFLPGRGKVAYYNEPSQARIDTGVTLGSEVGIFYDPMISKLIVHGEDRNQAVLKLERALQEYKIGGLVTNIPLLLKMVRNQDFKDYKYDLKFIEENEDSLISKDLQVDEDTLVQTVINLVFNEHLLNQDLDKASLQSPGQHYNENQNYKEIDNRLGQIPFSLQNFRLNQSFAKEFDLNFTYAYSQSEISTNIKGKVTQVSPNTYSLEYTQNLKNQENASLKVVDNIRFSKKQGTSSQLEIGDHFSSREFYLDQEQQNSFFIFDSCNQCLRVHNLKDQIEENVKVVDESLKFMAKAPMPGVVIMLNVKQGQVVKEGETVVVMSAMKMEHNIKVTRDCEISEVCVEVNDFVEAGQPLVKFKE